MPPNNMRPGFHRDPKAVARIAKGAQLAAIIHARAARAAEKAGGEVNDYVTDRAVSSIRVPAEEQAKNGAITKAAGELGWDIR